MESGLLLRAEAEGKWNMRGDNRLSWRQKLGIVVVIAIICIITLFIAFAPVFLRPNLRYKRDSYTVSKNHAVTSCVIKNYGYATADRTRMSVNFLSRILDVRFDPESAGKIVEITSDQFNAVLDLQNIAPKDEVTVFFTVEKPQEKPFDIYLMDIGEGGKPVRERSTPIK